MIEPILRKFDWAVIKPVWIALLAGGVFFLFQSQWLIGGALIALAVLGVGSVAASLHRERSIGELASGYPHRSAVTEAAPSQIDSETARRIVRAMVGLAVILGAAVALLGWHFGLKWSWILIYGVATMFLVPVLLALPLVLVMRAGKGHLS